MTECSLDTHVLYGSNQNRKQLANYKHELDI